MNNEVSGAAIIMLLLLGSTLAAASAQNQPYLGLKEYCEWYSSQYSGGTLSSSRRER